MKQKMINPDERRCTKCGSLQTHVRISTMERVCRSCGYIEKLEKEEINNG